MRNSIIADTGFWVALGSKKDKYHDVAILAAKLLPYDPITTWPVITETFYLLQKYQGVNIAQLFLEQIDQGSVAIFAIEARHLGQIQELVGKYADLPMDLADASLVILAEELGHGRILSTDQRDFNAYRWKSHKPFENLLLVD
jgi:predicted nucleic acid-binding protein